MRIAPLLFAFAVEATLSVVTLSGCGGDRGKSIVGLDPDATDPADQGACAHSLSDYAGDCRALDPPGAGEGVQVRFGPEDYDDPDAVKPFLLMPGEEGVECQYRRLPTDTPLFYRKYTVSSRPGMHHVILSSTVADVPDGFRDRCQARNEGASLLAVLQGGLDGSVYEYPPAEGAAPENEGLATRLEPGAMIAYELHAVNATEAPLLKETWTNFIRMPADEVTSLVGQIAFNGGLGMDIPPQTEEVITNSCTVPAGAKERRIVDLFGHVHAHGVRVTAYAVEKDTDGRENRTRIYESYDWADLDLVRYDSVTENPEPDRALGRGGGYSGILTLLPGDRIDYECEIHNTEDFSLRFAAETYTGEMCNMFGSYAPGNGGSWTCLGQ